MNNHSSISHTLAPLLTTFVCAGITSPADCSPARPSFPRPSLPASRPRRKLAAKDDSANQIQRLTPTMCGQRPQRVKRGGGTFTPSHTYCFHTVGKRAPRSQIRVWSLFPHRKLNPPDVLPKPLLCPSIHTDTTQINGFVPLKPAFNGRSHFSGAGNAASQK